MAVTIIGTGARIDVARDQAAATHPRIEIELFAEIDVDGAARRYGGGFGFADLEVDGDPTSQIVDAAHVQREINLGNLLGDMKIARLDVTRFELYSAPFRIELSDNLRASLAGRWKQRDPRPDAWRWPPHAGN